MSQFLIKIYHEEYDDLLRTHTYQIHKFVFVAINAIINKTRKIVLHSKCFSTRLQNNPINLVFYVSVIDRRVPCDFHILSNERNLENS